MNIQNYLLIDTNNVVENIVRWDGESEWVKPEGFITILKSTTPAKIWDLNKNVSPNVYELIEVMGSGDLGFTWDGTVLTTNHPQPTQNVNNTANTSS